MEYIKLGQVFEAKGQYDWMHYYSAPDTAVEFDDFIRLYFTSRSKQDEHGFFQTYIGFVDCDKKDPTKVIRVSDKPLLQPGTTGTFDEHGTMISDVIVHEGKYYMFYIGWQRSGGAPYINTIGLALSDDGEHFTKVSAGPIIGLTHQVPYGLGNVSVLVMDGVFHMWYTHYKPWIASPAGYRPNYDIRYAWSKNALDWQCGVECIAPAYDNESLAAPCVRVINGKYHMWYSYRPAVGADGKSGGYLIGYASSEDGKNWTRNDESVGLTLSESGWDSEMMCAPDVLETKENTYLFYCGNMYGRDGVGCAIIKGI